VGLSVTSVTGKPVSIKEGCPVNNSGWRTRNSAKSSSLWTTGNQIKGYAVILGIDIIREPVDSFKFENERAKVKFKGSRHDGLVPPHDINRHPPLTTPEPTVLLPQRTTKVSD
jgi:hypothetical protein